MRLAKRALLGCIFLIWSGTAASSLISNIDLSTFDFQIDSLTQNGAPVTGTGVETNVVATGTSNGIGWSISPTTYWMARTYTNDGFCYNSQLSVCTDNLHASGTYTITFDQMLDSLLVALSNDNYSDSINFQLTPTDFTGNLFFNGTQAVLSQASGGLALFKNINSLTITNLNDNGVNDGYDLAFHAFASVPEPASVILFALGIAGLGLFRRVKHQS